jgi:magnesium transporter
MQLWLDRDNGLVEGDEATFDKWQASRVGNLCIFAGNEDAAFLTRVLTDLHVHPLAVQDFMRDRHPPKYEVFPEYRLFLMRVLPHQGKSFFFQPIQLSILVGENWFICRYQTRCMSGDSVVTALRLKAHLPSVGLLAWEIVETVAIHYLEWLMYLESRIGHLEDLMLTASGDRVVSDVISLKTGLRKHRRNFLYLERVATQVREKGIGVDVLPHSPECNDLYEKWERVHSMAAMFYEQLGDMIDGYISQSSYKLNVTMRVLTVITAIFIPLSFIAGLYGMNFTHMPELHYHYAYFIVLILMLAIGLGMVIWFRKIKWL